MLKLEPTREKRPISQGAARSGKEAVPGSEALRPRIGHEDPSAKTDEPRGESSPLLPFIIRFAALTGAFGLTCLTLTLILSRIAVNFDHDWVESTVARSVLRISAGETMYPPPSAVFLGDAYPPFFMYLCASVSRFTGNSLFAARLISVLATGLVLLALHRISSDTRNLTGLNRPITSLERLDRFFPILLLPAFYAASGQTFDLARVDMTTLAFTSWAAVLAIKSTSMRGALLAGLLMAAAILTKHNIVLMGGVIGAGVLLHSPRRAVVFGATALSIPAVAFIVMHQTTEGWSSFHLFEQLARNEFGGAQRWIRFFAEDVGWHGVLMTGLLAAGFIAVWTGPTERAGFDRRHLAAVSLLVIGGLAMTISGRQKVGGFPNNLVPAWTFALFAMAWFLPRVRSRIHDATPAHRTLWNTVVSVMLLGVVVSLGFTYSRLPIHQYLNSERRAKAVAELQQLVNQYAASGPVWIPAHSGVMPNADHYAHLCPIGFTVDTENFPARSLLESDVLARLGQQHWSAIILDDPRDKFISPAVWKTLIRTYEEMPWPIRNPDRLSSLTGKITRPSRLFVRRANPRRPAAELAEEPTEE